MRRTWDGRLPTVMLKAGGGWWTLAGRRHQSAKWKRASSSRANRRVRHEDYQNRRRGGYGEASVPVALGRLETGEIVDLKLTRAKFLEHFANRAPVWCDGGVRAARSTGAPASGAWPRGPAATGEGGSALCVRQQERCARRTGDLDGGAAARRQDGAVKSEEQQRSSRCTVCASSW